MKLVIVESPSKAKTIQKYLGKDYKVDASGGHIRDLPVKELGVDIKNNFQPKYVVNPTKKETVKRLADSSKKAENVYLATDPDREGEAISWHLAYLLGISQNEKNRIVFNEISSKAVKAALQAPREININLVNAQQARRVLDRLVGYKISPLLCKRIDNKLSAGRVQSVALRLIIEREREIINFIPQEYWVITAEISLMEGKQSDVVFKTALALKDGKKFKPVSKEEADEVLNEVKRESWAVESVKEGVLKRHAPPPFTTSTLQQDASNKLSMTSPVTMAVAQNLYEGVDIQGEHIALVTYIRTDSVRVSPDAQQDALEFIKKHYGNDYAPQKPNFYRTKKSAQDAHEAIRPISLEITPESIKDKVQKNHYRLYKLIYQRFLASQMSEAVFNTLNVDIKSGRYTFKSSGSSVKFKGYTAVYDDYREEKEENNINIPNLKAKDLIKLHKIDGEQKFTNPPPRYTDASLVKAMEEKGIGRPSTYASVINVLLKRQYTQKEGRQLIPTELAFKVNDLLVKYFDDLINVKFTAQMEEKLDGIEEGGDWQGLIADFYPDFEKQLKTAFENSVEVTDEKCPKCGASMVVKVGRYGKFLGCPNYPECDYIKSLEEPETTDEVCEKCGSPMVYKKSRYGKFLACSNYPECTNIKSDDKQSDQKCPQCGKFMVERMGKYGKYNYCADCKKIESARERVAACPECGKNVVKKFTKSKKIFYGCEGYPKCKFASWDIPSDSKCPQCGKYMVIKNLKSGNQLKCSDKKCGYGVKIEQDG